MSLHLPVPDERGSAPPLAMDMASHQTGSLHIHVDTGSFDQRGWARRIPTSWLGMSGYLAAGVFLGLVLILALTLSRSGDPAPTANANVVTDNVVHLKSREIGDSCWSGLEKNGPARVTVSMEVGLDGKVRSAVASGESTAMRSCVETHVKGWEFLPQAQAQAMVLPFEIDRR